MSPDEIITGPYTVWIAPVGTAFPEPGVEPGSAWTRLGTNGARSYADGGVSVQHLRRFDQAQPAGSPAPTMAWIAGEQARISLELMDLTLEQYAHALGGNAVTRRPGPDGAGSLLSIGLSLRPRGQSAMALLVRGQSPYDEAREAQYEVARCIEVGSPRPVFRRGRPATLALEFTALVDPAAKNAEERFGRLVADEATELLFPSGSYDGTPSSGFASEPVDPQRTTAKPAARLLVPHSLPFTDNLLVGIEAYAKGGIARVIAHYEGNSAELTERSIETPGGHPAEHGGSAVEPPPVRAWWTRLAHSGVNGTGRVFFEVVPNDPTMQSRIIGPFSFHPFEGYDADLEIAPSQTEVAGSRYQSIGAAIEYCRTNSRDFPKITVVEAGDYDLVAPQSYSPKGRVRIEATAPVRFYRPPNASSPAIRPRYPSHFVGKNITIDLAGASEFYIEVGIPEQVALANVFDGVTITDSNGRGSLIERDIRAAGHTVRAPYFMLDCAVTDLPNPATNAELVRCGSFDRCFADLFSSSKCVVGPTVRDLDSSVYRIGFDALNITGPANGTVESSGTVSQKTFTFREGGTEVGAITLEKVDFVSDLADAVNALVGWNATVLNNGIVPTVLSLATGKPADQFAAQDVSSGLTLKARFDYHSDIWQSQAAHENVIVDGFLAYDCRAQMFLISRGFALKDAAFVNNLAFQNPAASPIYDNAVTPSYLEQNAGSGHIFFDHNTMPDQRLLFEALDDYSSVSNNVLRRLDWFSGKETDGKTIDGNHLSEAGTAPQFATGTTIGGTTATLTQDYAAEDLRAAGDLLLTLRAPTVPFDRGGARRGATDVVGALSNSAASPEVGTVPVYAVAPLISGAAITGTPQDDEVLTFNATISGTPPLTIEYRWGDDDGDYSGEESQSLLLDAAAMTLVHNDVIEGELTVANAQGTASATATRTFVDPAQLDPQLAALLNEISGIAQGLVADLTESTDDGTLTVANQADGTSDLVQGTAGNKPSMDASGAMFDGDDFLRYDITNNRTWTVYIRFAKDAAHSGPGKLFTSQGSFSPLVYHDGSTAAQSASTTLDPHLSGGTSIADCNALHDGIDDAAAHVIKITGWGTASWTMFRFGGAGNPSDGIRGAIDKIVAFPEDGLSAQKLSDLRAAAEAWMAA